MEQEIPFTTPSWIKHMLRSPKADDLDRLVIQVGIPVLLAKWLVSLTSDREVPGTISTGSKFFCAVTRGTGYSWTGMRVKCILYTVGYIILGRNACLYFDLTLKYLYLFYT